MKIFRNLLIFIILMLGALTACTAESSLDEAIPLEAPESTSTAAPLPEPTKSPTPLVAEEESELTQPASCQANPPRPTPIPELVELFTPDQEVDQIKGAEDARITIVEYADFQCPYCATTSSVLGELVERYPEDVQLVYRHFPLGSIHDKALLSTQAAEAAGMQGEFWSMHDLLYETQGEWSSLTPDEFINWVVDQAENLGMNREQFAEDLESEDIQALAQTTWEEGQQIGIPGTPFVMIDNRQFDAHPDLETLVAIVELIKLEDNQFSQCPPRILDEEKDYQARLVTEKGDILIDFYPGVAPLAVNSFLFLAEKDWFDGITFHRVLEDYIAQSGDPSGTGYGGPGYTFGVETFSDLTFDRAGLVAMANSGPDTNGSQFFITYGPAPDLNGQYTIFGEVAEGMDVVESLTPRNPQAAEPPPTGDILLDVIIEEK